MDRSPAICGAMTAFAPPAAPSHRREPDWLRSVTRHLAADAPPAGLQHSAIKSRKDPATGRYWLRSVTILPRRRPKGLASFRGKTSRHGRSSCRTTASRQQIRKDAGRRAPSPPRRRPKFWLRFVARPLAADDPLPDYSVAVSNLQDGGRRAPSRPRRRPQRFGFVPSQDPALPRDYNFGKRIGSVGSAVNMQRALCPQRGTTTVL